MTNKAFFLFFFLIGFAVFGQKIITKNYESEELQETRSIKIYLPKNYEKDSIANFPLTIVLDTENLFDLYTANASFFALTDKAPEQIIIGINIDKTRYKDTGFTKGNSALTGSSRAFFNFIRDEILLYGEATYRTSPFITIVGKGLSGNFITHFLKEEIPIFNAFICINPIVSIDTNTQIQSYSLNRYQTLDDTFYFYLSGNPKNGSVKNERIAQFGSLLNSFQIQNFHMTYDLLKNAPSSESAISEAIPRALTKIFELYAGVTKEEFDKNIKNLSPPEAILYLETKYLDIEYLFGANLGIRERDIFAIESIIIDKENGDYLKDFGKMILKIYPSSPMGNYYIGLFYETGKQYKKALKQYRIGYGKMNPSDPNADKFYENILRLGYQ